MIKRRGRRRGEGKGRMSRSRRTTIVNLVGVIITFSRSYLQRHLYIVLGYFGFVCLFYT